MKLDDIETCDLVEELHSRGYDFLNDEDTDDLVLELESRRYDFLANEPTDNLIYILENEGYTVTHEDENQLPLSSDDLRKVLEVFDSIDYKIGSETHLLRERLHEVLRGL